MLLFAGSVPVGFSVLPLAVFGFLSSHCHGLHYRFGIIFLHFVPIVICARYLIMVTVVTTGFATVVGLTFEELSRLDMKFRVITSVFFAMFGVCFLLSCSMASRGTAHGVATAALVFQTRVAGLPGLICGISAIFFRRFDVSRWFASILSFSQI